MDLNFHRLKSASSQEEKRSRGPQSFLVPSILVCKQKASWQLTCPEQILFDQSKLTPMKLLGKRIAQSQNHSSRVDAAYWFAHALCLTILLIPAVTHSNPYLAKSGETPVTVYVATCATSGGFIHLYTALDQNILRKYGIMAKHVVIRTGTNINLAALGSDEIQFLYCAGDSTIPGMAAGADATLVASPLVGLPYVIIARKEIKTIQDLKGKSIGVGSVGGLPFRLLKRIYEKIWPRGHPDSTRSAAANRNGTPQ